MGIYFIWVGRIRLFLVKASTIVFSEILFFFATETTTVFVATSGTGVERPLLRSVSSVRLVSALPSLDSTNPASCIPGPGFLFLSLGPTSVEPDLVMASEADLSLSRTEQFLVDLRSIILKKSPHYLETSLCHNITTRVRELGQA